jgi:integrase
VVDRTGVACRARLREQHAEPARHERLLDAFRHTFSTAGVSTDVVQSYLGHIWPATTALNNKAGARRRQREIGKLFRDYRRHATCTLPGAHHAPVGRCAVPGR